MIRIVNDEVFCYFFYKRKRGEKRLIPFNQI